MEPKSLTSVAKRWLVPLAIPTLTLALLAVPILTLGPNRALATISTEWMYGQGWPCFAGWLVVTILAMPWRVRGLGWPREIAHGVLWALACSWWLAAIFLADLRARADMLWFAYLTAGLAILAWRVCLHQRILRYAVRVSLRKEMHAGAVLRLIGAGSIPTHRRYRCPISFAIDRVARFHHDVRWWRITRTFLFGSVGASAIAIEESMRHTDEKADTLRDLLASESGSDERTLRRAARNLALAFRSEVEIWVAIRAHCPEANPGLLVQLRAISVGSSLAMAAVRSGSAIAIAFGRSLSILADHESLSSVVAGRVAKLRRMDHESAGSVVRNEWPNERMSPNEIALGRIAMAVALARLGLFRLAGGSLGTGIESIGDRQTEDGPPDIASTPCRVVRSLHALQSELDRRSLARAKAKVVSDDDARPIDPLDAEVLRRREGSQRYHQSRGDHPLEGTKLRPSHFGRLPLPSRVREIGGGTLASAVVLVWSILLLWPYLSPLSARLHVIRDVPAGPEFRTGTTGSSTLAGPSDAPVALVEDPKGGVKTFAPATFRMGYEGGEGTPLDGAVRELVANPDGTTLALFDERTSGTACVSYRDADGDWSPVIVPPGTALAGSEIEAFLPGLGEPLLLRRSGIRRLLRYDEKGRSVFEAEAEDSTPIEGIFVDSAEVPVGPGGRGAVLLTRASDGTPRLWGISETSPGKPLSVQSMSIPPLGERTPVAIDVDERNRLVVLDSAGGVWRRDYAIADATWTRLRPGDQDLSLDSVDLAIVTESGRRLWFLRKGEIWTRRLATADEFPGTGDGWSRLMLPAGTAASIDHRSFLLETGRADGKIHLLVPTAEVARGPGSILELSVSALARPLEGGGAVEAINSKELLLTSESLVDADRNGRSAAITVEVPPSSSGGYRVLRQEFVSANGRAEIRSMPVPGSRAEESLRRSIAGILPGLGGSLVLLDDGRFVKFDPRTDTLLPFQASGQIFAAIRLGPSAVDVALSGMGSPTAQVLRRNGGVDEIRLAAPVQESRTLVRADGFPGNDVLSGLEAVLTDESGASLFSRSSIWRYSLEDAANPFLDLSERLGKDADERMLIRDDKGRPAMAWLSDGGKVFRRFEAGEFSSRVLDSSLSGLRAGLGVDAFAMDRNGWLCSISSDGLRRLLPSQANGPNGVSDATIRPGFIDFLDAGRSRVHSIGRITGEWSAPLSLDAPHSLHSIGKTADARTVLLPVVEGIPTVLDPRRDLPEARKLGTRGAMVRPQILADGVIGIGKSDNAIGWVGIDGKSSSVLPSRAVPGADLVAVDEAISADNQVFLLGSASSGQPGSRVVRISFDGQPASTQLLAGASAMELAGDRLFVLESNQIVALASRTLERVGVWGLTDGPRSLGRSSGSPPPIVDTRGIWRPVTDGNKSTLKPVLAFPVAATFTRIDMAAAWDDQVMLLTPEGAWSRRDRSIEPFTRHPHIDGPVDAIVFEPAGGSPWARMRGEWISSRNGDTNGSSIGWLDDGSRITVAADGGLEVQGRSVAGFGKSPTATGALGGVEPIDGNAALLLLGSEGSAILDPVSRAFRPATPPLLASLTSNARILRDSRGNAFAWSESGLVTTLDPAKPTVLFGGKPVSEAILEPTRFAHGRDGTILDESGRPVPNAPPMDPGTRIETAQAVAAGSQIFRRQPNRRIDRFSTTSFTTHAETAEADAIGAIGNRVFTLDRRERRITELGGPKIGDADDWFVGRDAIAFLDSRSGLRILDTAGVRDELRLAAPLPGESIGNIPGESVVLTRNEDGSHSLYDVRGGRTVVARLPGKSPLLAASSVVMTDEAGVAAISIDARGDRRESERFTSLVAATNGSDVTVAGLRGDVQSVSVVLLDPLSLRERESILQRSADFAALASMGTGSARVVPIDPETTMILTPRAIALDDGRTVRLITNPLRSKDLVMWLGPGEVIASDREGQVRRLLDRSTGRWELVDRFLEVDRAFFPRWQAFPGRYLDSHVAPSYLQLSVGMLDLETGWIVGKKPMGLVERAGRIEVTLADGDTEIVRRLDPDRTRKYLAPLSEGPDGEISFVGDGGTERLGIPRAGARLAVHEIRKAIPRTGGGPAIWIDALGQLWTRRGSERRMVAGGLGLTDFSVDEAGDPLVRSDRGLWRIGDGPNGAMLIAETGPIRRWMDHSYLPASLGPIHWSPPPSEGPGEFRWSVKVEEQQALVAVQPTGRGFDFLANPRLVLREGVPWIAAGPESSRISAPLRADGVAWARIRLAAGTVAPPVPATPKREFNAGADGKISIGVDGAHLEFAGIRFAYRPELARFDCQTCRAATGFGDRVITMLGNDELMSWTRRADGSLRDPVRIPPSPGHPAAALWSDGSGVILETAPNADEARSQFAWDGKAWSDHRTSRLARRTDAAWDWDGEGTLKVRGRPCQIQFDRFPRLDFEDIDPAEDRRGAPLRSLADDRVVYRTAGGRWYSVTSSGLPEPLSESPPSMPDNAAVGDLSFTRWPTDGPFPRCTLAGMDGSSTISLKVESGLIRDLDGWDSSSELLRVADDRMRVRMRAVGVYREIQLKDGRLDLSPPRYLRDVENDRREAGLPLRKDGPLALNKGHGILCGELLLGVPGPKGLTGLDAGSAVPLSLSRPGGATTLEYVVPDGSRYRVQVDRVLDSIVRIATDPTIDRTRWEVSGGKIELVAEAKDGRRFLVEAAGVPPKPINRKREDMAELVRSTDAGLVPQRADRGSLRLTRGGDRPLTVIMRQAADGLTLDHLDANRIGNLDDGLMTFSPRWVTRYARSGETLSVHSIVPAEGGPKPVETLPLGGGLFARHIGSRGWELRTSEEPDAPRWDLERFTGPERTYLAGESAMFEAGNDWWRRSRLDGSIVERRVGADLASLANPTAFRDGEILADGEIRWSLDPDGTPSKIANREVAPRRLAKVESGPWTISLDRGGDDLSVAVAGRRMAVADGSLPIDFAVAVGGGRGHDWIIDRFGLQGSHQGTSRWTPHSDEPLASLGDAAPVRLAGLDWEGEIQRALPDRGGAWRLPMAEDPGLVRSDGRLLDSWTSGSRLAIRLGTDGQANFSRRPMASDPWFRYPSIDLGSACEAGRFAFDVPVALALAGSGDGSPPSACVRMGLGWERFEFGSGTGSSRFLLAEPEPVEPPYGSEPRDEWLTTSDLDLTAIRAAINDLGPISLAFPFEGRLFLLGEDRSAWIELGKRWRDRPLP